MNERVRSLLLAHDGGIPPPDTMTVTIILGDPTGPFHGVIASYPAKAPWACPPAALAPIRHDWLVCTVGSTVQHVLFLLVVHSCLRNYSRLDSTRFDSSVP